MKQKLFQIFRLGLKSMNYFFFGNFKNNLIDLIAYGLFRVFIQSLAFLYMPDPTYS